MISYVSIVPKPLTYLEIEILGSQKLLRLCHYGAYIWFIIISIAICTWIVLNTLWRLTCLTVVLTEIKGSHMGTQFGLVWLNFLLRSKLFIWSAHELIYNYILDWFFNQIQCCDLITNMLLHQERGVSIFPLKTRII